ncbi:MAG: hypothetical protein ACEY26_00050 [Candidatus Hodgkinia cicadicola]
MANVTTDRNVSYIFIDNSAFVIITAFSVRMIFKLSYKSKLHLTVCSILKNLTILIGPESKLILTTNGILQPFELNLIIKLMSRSKAQVNTNVIAALSHVSFSTNVIALEQFANVKLVYNVLLLRRSSLSLKPAFELRGKTTKCVHSILIKNQYECAGYASNRLITPETINALMFYAKCIM